MTLNERRAANRLSETCRTRGRKLRENRMLWRSFLEAGRVWVVLIFEGSKEDANLIFQSRSIRKEAALNDAARWIRAKWPAGRPGAPKGNRNAAGWPMKKAMREQAGFHRSLVEMRDNF
jgi:hypothetical protein